jgi:hypothetical protein
MSPMRCRFVAEATYKNPGPNGTLMMISIPNK